MRPNVKTKDNSRTNNTKRNIITSFLLMLFTYLFQFISKTLIVEFLGDQYLGLSSLFSSILQVLNMAELGFSTAVVYNMYKPLAIGDDKTVCSLMAFYKKIYRIIGCIVLGCGVALTPFIQYLIKGDYPTTINIYILYIIYVIDSAITYFLFAYKSSLLNALQKMDIAKLVNIIVCVFQYSFQVITLIVFRNYYAFVVAKIVGTSANNIITGYLADKFYPQYHASGTLSKKEKQDIVVRVKGLMISKVCETSYTTFDSIILSSMFGLSIVAVYNNYIYVFTAVTALVMLITNGMQASIGNSIAIEPLDKNYEDIFTWQFLFSVIAIWGSTFMLCLYQPFMELWMGSSRLLSITDVVLICSWFISTTFKNSITLYLTGNGMWWNVRIPSILSAVFNIIMNVLLGYCFGTSGIILSSFLSSLVFGFVWNAIIIFRDYFQRSPRLFLLKQLRYLLLNVFVSALTYYMCTLFVTRSGILDLAMRGLMCFIIPPCIVFVSLFKTKEFKSSKILLLHVLKIKR